jgi:hypothetical protein
VQHLVAMRKTRQVCGTPARCSRVAVRKKGTDIGKHELNYIKTHVHAYYMYVRICM